MNKDQFIHCYILEMNQFDALEGAAYILTDMDCSLNI